MAYGDAVSKIYGFIAPVPPPHDAKLAAHAAVVPTLIDTYKGEVSQLMAVLVLPSQLPPENEQIEPRLT
jgi:hypothetical protein